MTYNAYQKLAFLMSLSKENNASNINGSVIRRWVRRFLQNTRIEGGVNAEHV
jgi:hypothetical protein